MSLDDYSRLDILLKDEKLVDKFIWDQIMEQHDPEADHPAVRPNDFHTAIQNILDSFHVRDPEVLHSVGSYFYSAVNFQDSHVYMPIIQDVIRSVLDKIFASLRNKHLTIPAVKLTSFFTKIKERSKNGVKLRVSLHDKNPNFGNKNPIRPQSPGFNAFRNTSRRPPFTNDSSNQQFPTNPSFSSRQSPMNNFGGSVPPRMGNLSTRDISPGMRGFVPSAPQTRSPSPVNRNVQPIEAGPILPVPLPGVPGLDTSVPSSSIPAVTSFSNPYDYNQPTNPFRNSRHSSFGRPSGLRTTSTDPRNNSPFRGPSGIRGSSPDPRLSFVSDTTIPIGLSSRGRLPLSNMIGYNSDMIKSGNLQKSPIWQGRSQITTPIQLGPRDTVQKSPSWQGRSTRSTAPIKLWSPDQQTPNQRRSTRSSLPPTTIKKLSGYCSPRLLNNLSATPLQPAPSQHHPYVTSTPQVTALRDDEPFPFRYTSHPAVVRPPQQPNNLTPRHTIASQNPTTSRPSIVSQNLTASRPTTYVPTTQPLADATISPAPTSNVPTTQPPVHVTYVAPPTSSLPTTQSPASATQYEPSSLKDHFATFVPSTASRENVPTSHASYVPSSSMENVQSFVPSSASRENVPTYISVTSEQPPSYIPSQRETPIPSKIRPPSSGIPERSPAPSSRAPYMTLAPIPLLIQYDGPIRPIPISRPPEESIGESSGFQCPNYPFGPASRHLQRNTSKSSNGLDSRYSAQATPLIAPQPEIVGYNDTLPYSDGSGYTDIPNNVQQYPMENYEPYPHNIPYEDPNIERARSIRESVYPHEKPTHSSRNNNFPGYYHNMNANDHPNTAGLSSEDLFNLTKYCGPQSSGYQSPPYSFSGRENPDYNTARQTPLMDRSMSSTQEALRQDPKVTRPIHKIPNRFDHDIAFVHNPFGSKTLNKAEKQDAQKPCGTVPPIQNPSDPFESLRRLALSSRSLGKTKLPEVQADSARMIEEKNMFVNSNRSITPFY